MVSIKQLIHWKSPRDGGDLRGPGVGQAAIRSPTATPAPESVATEVTAAVERYIAEGRCAGLDDAALLAILRTKLTHQDE